MDTFSSYASLETSIVAVCFIHRYDLSEDNLGILLLLVKKARYLILVQSGHIDVNANTSDPGTCVVLAF